MRPDLNHNKGYLNPSRIAFYACLLVSFAISLYFHNKTWWAPDDGFYALTSQSMLDGEILFKDIKVLHAGLIYFINAFFLSLANGDMVGMRYPLILLTVIQAGLAYKITEKQGVLVAVAAASVMTAYSFIQWVNPTPNWYCLCLTLGIIYLLINGNTKSTKTILLVGFLVGVAFLLRQLNGIVLAVAVTAVIFLQNSNLEVTESKLAGKILLFSLAIATTLYVVTISRISGFIIVALYPLLILFLCAKRCEVDTKRTLEIVCLLLVGAAISAVPLFVYCSMNGALVDWFQLAIIDLVAFTKLPTFDRYTYLFYPAMTLSDIFTKVEWLSIPGFLYWFFLLSTPYILGVIVIGRFFLEPSKINELGIVASIYGISAVFYESYFYLQYCIGPIIVGILLLIERRNVRSFFAIVVLCISAMAIFYHAGQPLSRSHQDRAKNIRKNYEPAIVPNTSIIDTKEEREKYVSILNFIDHCTSDDDSVSAFPYYPEVNFLSRRKSGFDFFASYIGLKSDEDVSKNIEAITSGSGATLILHNDASKFNTKYLRNFVAGLEDEYIEIGKISHWNVYMYKEHDSSCLNKTKIYWED